MLPAASDVSLVVIVSGVDDVSVIVVCAGNKKVFVVLTGAAVCCADAVVLDLSMTPVSNFTLVV